MQSEIARFVAVGFWNPPMNFDGTITLGTVLIGLVQFAAVIAAYYGLKSAIAAVASDLALSMLSERSERRAEYGALKEQVMNAVSAVEALVKDLARRVGALETGQDEWTKTLRARTHDLSNQIGVLVLKVDRLERPEHTKQEPTHG